MPGSLSLWSALPWNLTENVGRLVVKLKEIVGGPRQMEKGRCHSLPTCWREELMGSQEAGPLSSPSTMTQNAVRSEANTLPRKGTVSVEQLRD